jgi:poly [ADP-ribose] polymerase
MAETIEIAKTGRARCRSCRQPIEKGALRFGEEQPSQFAEGMQWAWYHLPCAAKSKPVPLRAAMDAFGGEIPDRAEIEAAMTEADTSATEFPYAERAPTGRSRCLQCREPIEKDALRIATQRELEMGRTGAGYLHPRCAREFVGDDGLSDALHRNSRGLGERDLAQLDEELGAA